MRKQSKVKRLVSRSTLSKLAKALPSQQKQWKAAAEREAQASIAKWQERGWQLVTRLEHGEAVFTKEQDIVPLHIHLPRALYNQLEAHCKTAGVTKRHATITALEDYLEGAQ